MIYSVQHLPTVLVILIKANIQSKSKHIIEENMLSLYSEYQNFSLHYEQLAQMTQQIL